MKKKLLFIPLFALALIGCESVSINDTSTSIEHHFSDAWSKDDTHHWHECTDEGCTEKADYAEHTYGEWTVVTEPTEEEEGLQERVCSVCSYKQSQIIPNGDRIDEMNELIKDQSFDDGFAVRDTLLDAGFHFNATLPDGLRYGYSEDSNKVVEHKDGVIVAPEECIGDRFINFESVTINSFNGLVETLEGINNGTNNYSVITLGSSITQASTSNLAQYRGTRSIEIDLANNTIEAPTEVEKAYNESKWYTLQFMDKTDTASIYVHGGVVEANRKMQNDNVQDDSCCLSLVAAKSMRLANLTLNAKNATSCIGDLSQYVTNHNDNNKKVIIDNVRMDATLKAMTIAGGTWTIKNCENINAMVVIEGGRVNINNCKVDASNARYNNLNNYTQGYTNDALAAVPVTKLNGNTVSTNVLNVLRNYYGALTFNDAIAVVSRRSGAYFIPEVSVSNSTLIPVMVEQAPNTDPIPTGYGIRYWDIDNRSGDPVAVSLTNPSFPKLDTSGFGGANFDYE